MAIIHLHSISAMLQTFLIWLETILPFSSEPAFSEQQTAYCCGAENDDDNPKETVKNRNRDFITRLVTTRRVWNSLNSSLSLRLQLLITLAILLNNDYDLVNFTPRKKNLLLPCLYFYFSQKHRCWNNFLFTTARHIVQTEHRFYCTRKLENKSKELHRQYIIN